VADEAVNRLGAMLEELGAPRFDLVVEAVFRFRRTTRFPARRNLRPVCGSRRPSFGFSPSKIAENRRGIIATHDDLGAEIIRLGEALGKARVEFRDELAAGAKRGFVANL